MDIEEAKKIIMRLLDDEKQLMDIDFHIGRCSAFRFILELLDDVRPAGDGR